MHVDATDDDAAVRARAVIVEIRRDAASNRERDKEPEACEHRPFPTWTQMVMQVESLLDLVDQKLSGSLLGHGRTVTPPAGTADGAPPMYAAYAARRVIRRVCRFPFGSLTVAVIV